MWLAKIDVTLKKTVLDPQGETVLRALQSLGFEEVKGMRVGKHFELTLDGVERSQVEGKIKAMCEKLLINPVIEEYLTQVVEIPSE